MQRRELIRPLPAGPYRVRGRAGEAVRVCLQAAFRQAASRARKPSYRAPLRPVDAWP